MTGLAPAYAAFLAAKAPRAHAVGIPTDPDVMPAHLADFQRAATAFCLEQGRAGLFLSTGLGKTRCELEFATRAAGATNGRALILAPLAVGWQHAREAMLLGYDARVIRSASDVQDGINICNYDRLDALDADAFGAVVLDESSILKSVGGKISAHIIRSFAGHRFRLAATATPAPNDHMEIGQHAEFLGVMSGIEMLSRFFINDTSTASQKWRIKGHGQRAFWDWMASWSRMAQTPADMGFDGARYVLPEMHVTRHQTHGDVRPAAGLLFAGEISATTMHDVKRQTSAARADAVAALVAAEPKEPWVLWCDTNDEADALCARILGSVEVRGNMTTDKKEEILAAFADGGVRILVSKPSICGFGLNWQHCARMAFIGRTFSYEAYYQAVRRCWRFGQKRPVHVHLIVAEGEDQIGRVIDRKAADHVTMNAAMAEAMQRAMGAASAIKVRYEPTHEGRLPTWLGA